MLASEHPCDIADTMKPSPMTALVRAAAEMWSQQDIAHAQQGRVDPGFVFENVQRRAGKVAGLECGHQRGSVHDAAARGANAIAATLHLGQTLRADKPA